MVFLLAGKLADEDVVLVDDEDAEPTKIAEPLSTGFPAAGRKCDRT